MSPDEAAVPNICANPVAIRIGLNNMPKPKFKNYELRLDLDYLGLIESVSQCCMMRENIEKLQRDQQLLSRRAEANGKRSASNP